MRAEIKGDEKQLIDLEWPNSLGIIIVDLYNVTMIIVCYTSDPR